MTVSRRQFLIGSGAATLISARGFEARAQAAPDAAPVGSFNAGINGPLILDSNENPLGPGQHVIDAVVDALGNDGAEAGRYHFAQQGATRQAVADSIGLEPNNILLGAGSSEMLRLTAETYTGKDRPYVMADPSFALGERYARLLKHPVRKVPLNSNLRVDLDAMGDASDGAGLVYICNPNNPTATIHSGTDLHTFIESVLFRSPETRFLIDEAYGEYVTDDAFESMLSLVTEHPQVMVAKTLSKAYGMAGLRVGYIAAHPDTVNELSCIRGMDMYTSHPARAGAIVALNRPEHIARERERNSEVRRFTESFLSSAGLEGAASHGNFIFFDTGQSGEAFKKACLSAGIRVRAEYPSYPTHARISLGTMAEMKQAADVISRLV
jgi:histidinol-phosphate aminotransferase